MKFGNLEVTAKNVHTHQGREGIGLRMTVWVNGKKTVEYYDDANGGGGFWDGVYDPEMFKLLDDEIDRQPNRTGTIPLPNGKERPFNWKYGVDDLANDLLGEWEKAKNEKAMKRKCKTCICWGNPEADSYSYYDLKSLLAKLKLKDVRELSYLQVKNYIPTLKKGEVIFNKNLPIPPVVAK